jgi:ABC-type Mn2+/Zn2+ transport system permease subunit
VAVAFVIGASPTAGALLAALAMVGSLNVLRSRSPLPDDTSIGVLFVGFLALAVVVMSSQSASYAGDLNRFLFGSVTGVTDADLIRQAFAAAIALVGVIVFHRSFLVLSFDEVQAQLLGLRPRLANGVLLALVAVAVVATFETVGNLLVFAFLVAPPATASLLVRRVPHIMVTAVAVGSLAVVVGLLVSFHQGSVAPSATMALVATALFVVAVVARSVVESMGRHSVVRVGPDAHHH